MGVSCGICGNHVAWMLDHSDNDRTEIFAMLKDKGMSIACPDSTLHFHSPLRYP